MILRVHFKRQSTLKSVIGIYVFVIHTYNPFMRKYSFALKLYENVCLSRLSRKCSRLWKKICLKNFNSSIEFDANCMFFMFYKVLFERNVAYGWGSFAHFYELWLKFVERENCFMLSSVNLNLIKKLHFFSFHLILFHLNNFHLICYLINSLFVH